jgi:hypothetical protein
MSGLAWGGRRTRVIVWDEPALVYLRVPKSANSSIRAALPGGVQRRIDIRTLGQRHPRHLAFSFVRNPWGRLVSVWAEKIRNKPVTRGPYVEGVHRCFLRRGLPVRAGMPFAEFADLACALPDERTEKHLRSQCFYLVRDGALVPRFLGRVEEIAEDWAKLAALAGFEAPLPHVNPGRHADWASYYDPPLAARVGERYRADVETFGYAFPSGPRI